MCAKTTSTLLLAVALCSVSLGARGAQNTPPALISIAIDPAQSDVKAGADAKKRIILTNLSSQEMLISWDNANRGELDYKISVLDANGHEPSETQYLRAVRGEDSSNPDGKTQLVIAPSFGLRQLGPHSTITDWLDLNKLYDLRPGKYTLQVQRLDDEKRIVKSNTATLTVTP